MRCYDRRVLLALGVVAVGAVIARPGSAWTVLLLLALLACPLSMLVMMRSMGGARACAATGGAEDESAAQEVERLRAELAELRKDRAVDGEGTPDNAR